VCGSDTLTCITGEIAEVFYDKYRPSETIILAHKMASQFVSANPIEKDDEFQEKQKVCLTMALRESNNTTTPKDIKDKGWLEDYDVKSPDTAMQKFKKLFDL
jgi:hypothetical protein